MFPGYCIIINHVFTKCQGLSAGSHGQRKTQSNPQMNNGRRFSPGSPKTTLKGSCVHHDDPLLHTELRAPGGPLSVSSSRICFYPLLYSGSDCIPLWLRSYLGLWSLHLFRCFHGYFTISVHISLLLWIQVQVGILGTISILL